MSYINFLSFARGIQNGYNSNNYPILSEVEADEEYKKVLNRLCSAYSIEQDILKQFSDGDLDQWEAVEQLEDELGYSYDEACRKISSINSSSILSANANAPVIDDANAYWIDPAGKILVVGISHINTICDFPAAFGLLDEDVVRIFKEYGEPLRFEGKARDVLIKRALDRGWIRIRYNPSEDVYHVELHSLTNKHKDFLWLWSLGLIKANNKRTYSGVLICEYRNEDDYDYVEGTIKDLSSFKLFSSYGMGFNLLIPIKNNWDFLSIAPYAKAYSSKKRRKRSKYNGALVNNTFDESTGAISTVVPASPISISASCLMDAHVILSLMQFVNADAYWISPSGKLLPVHDLHITEVVSDPPSFGLSKDYVFGLFEKYNESLDYEGEARREIMELLIKKGWIRIRFYNNGKYYTISVNTLNSRAVDYISEWAGLVLRNISDSEFYQASIIVSFPVYEVLNYYLDDLSDGVLYKKLNQSMFRDVSLLIPISNVAGILDLYPWRQIRDAISSYYSKRVNIRSHPSIRYLVVSHLLHPSKRHLIKCSLSGEIDTFLLQNYCSGLGHTNVGENLIDTGKNGRVMLKFDSDSGYSTEVDLGGNLGTGYVVTSINDELGLFPADTVEGDFLINDIVQEILRAQGERDRR